MHIEQGVPHRDPPLLKFDDQNKEQVRNNKLPNGHGHEPDERSSPHVLAQEHHFHRSAHSKDFERCKVSTCV